MPNIHNGMPSNWDSNYDDKIDQHFYTKSGGRDESKKHAPSTHKITNAPMDYIPLQHGSPETKRNYVYPSRSSPIKAFQLNSKVPLQDMQTIPSRSPFSFKNGKIKDSSFTVINPQSSIDSDDAVAKISAMFPTVSETHIKLLLKKYLNREALVISALQVEKYPITTPGPFSTPPPQRNIFIHPKGTISHSGSPILKGFAALQGFRSSPKPHHSPKLKLRYMKSIFPNADETIILEVLQNNDNSIQKTSDVLKDMGYNRKEIVKPLPVNKDEPKADLSVEVPEPEIIVPKLKTNSEKQQIKEKLQVEHKDLPEHLITIALDSVNFNEKRAGQILKIINQEYADAKNMISKKFDENSTDTTNHTNLMPISESKHSMKSSKSYESSVTSIDNNSIYKSANACKPKGHNVDFCIGPNETLLLDKHVKVQGPMKSFQKGVQGLAKGPNVNLLSKKAYACGPNKDLQKGAVFGLAKGSIFNQLKSVAIGDLE